MRVYVLCVLVIAGLAGEAVAASRCEFLAKRTGKHYTRHCPKDVEAYVARFRECYSGNELSEAEYEQQEARLKCDWVLCDGGKIYDKYEKQADVVEAVNAALAWDVDPREWQTPSCEEHN